MEVLRECLGKLRSGDVSNLTSEQCIDLDVERGSALCKTSFGLAVCFEQLGNITVRVSTGSVRDQLPKSTKPFNLKNSLNNAPEMFSIDDEYFSGLACTSGLNGGELVIQVKEN
jgi:hypothetical protein